MRQAGRYLPEYRAMKQKYSFVDLVSNPDLAASVTLQPMKRFHLDAAILFSDILIIPEALGFPYCFKEGGGIALSRCFESVEDLKTLPCPQEAVQTRLAYVGEAVRQTRERLPSDKALLGFAGAPWTLAAYLLEGGASKNFEKLKSFAYTKPRAFERLMDCLAEAVATLLKLQIQAGVCAVQLFDSHAGLCSFEDYAKLSLPWIGRISEHLGRHCPLIVFPRGMSARAESLGEMGIPAIGLDPSADLPTLSKKLPKTTLQGNLDPCLLNTEVAIVEEATTSLLEKMASSGPHIVNLGLGILPSARLDCVEAFVETVRKKGRPWRRD